MGLRRTLRAAAAASALALASVSSAFSPSPPPTRSASVNGAARDAAAGGSRVELYYKNYHSTYYEIVDVDGDRMSLLSLLNPPATSPSTTDGEQQSAVAEGTNEISGGGGRAAARASPVTQLRSIQDYHRHVLNEPYQMSIVRFSAPWCKVCKSTNVSWERMASKLSTTPSSSPGDNKRRIKFFVVSLDAKSKDAAATTALKDMLQVDRVPQGIVHYPMEGIYGKRVDLSRSNLSLLKKRLESYLNGEKDGEDGMMRVKWGKPGGIGE